MHEGSFTLTDVFNHDTPCSPTISKHWNKFKRDFWFAWSFSDRAS